MKKEVKITLNKEDRKCLLQAANILKEISSSSRCWTPNTIYDLLDKKYDNIDVELVWDYK